MVVGERPWNNGIHEQATWPRPDHLNHARIWYMARTTSRDLETGIVEDSSGL